jgi:hypothetical protein
MKKAIYLLCAILLILAFFLFALYGASSHSFDFRSSESLIYLSLIALYLFTAIFLFYSNSRKYRLTTPILVILVFFNIISLSYLLYEMMKTTIGDYSAFIPIGILLIAFGLSLRVFYGLFHNPIAYPPRCP